MITSNKISFDEVSEIIADIKNRGNSDLTKVMDFLNEDFEETKNLIVEFNNGLKYEYSEIPHQLYTQFRMSESQGKFFSQKISKNFKYKKI